VVYLAPDIATTLRQWQRTQADATASVFPALWSGRAACHSVTANPQPYDPLSHAGRHSDGLFTAHAPPYVCYPAPHAGASLEVVKELMGHRSLQMTCAIRNCMIGTKRHNTTMPWRRSHRVQGLQKEVTMDDMRQTVIDGFGRTWNGAVLRPHGASYLLDLHVFFAEVTVPLAHVSYREVDQFVERQHQDAGPGRPSIAALHALKHFFAFCLDHHAGASNPVKRVILCGAGIPSPKPSPRSRCSGCVPRSRIPWTGRCFS